MVALELFFGFRATGSYPGAHQVLEGQEFRKRHTEYIYEVGA